MGLKGLQKVGKKSLEEVIERGGGVAADKKTSKKEEWQAFNLRLRKDQSNEIDRLLKDRPGLSKTAWILEAIQEKIKRCIIK